MKTLLSNVKVTRMINATAVGTTTLTPSAPLDMQGFDGVLFIASFGTITDGTPDLQARQGKQSNMSDAATLLGSLVTAQDADDNKVLLLDIAQPRERFVDCQIVRGGATGSVVDGSVAIQYRTGIAPTTQHSTVAASKALTAPAEGTP